MQNPTLHLDIVTVMIALATLVFGYFGGTESVIDAFMRTDT